MISKTRIIVLAITAGLIGRGELAFAGDLVVPNANAIVEGNSADNFTFGNLVPSVRFQQFYTASQFPGSVVNITAISFRPDGVKGTAFTAMLPHVQVRLSTTQTIVTAFAHDPNNPLQVFCGSPPIISCTFSQNVGPDDTVVFDGPLTLHSANTGPVGGPKDFDIVIRFTTPFRYDPTKGNLLVDIRNFSTVATTFLDAVDFAPDPTGSSEQRATLHVDSGNVDSTIGTAFDAGLVTAFEFKPGPTRCPVGRDPLTLLSGLWTFSVDGFGPSLQPFASAGQFTASIGQQAGNSLGRLAITSTSSQDGQIVRLEADVGTYQILSGCSGGRLTFNLSTRPLQFDFFFVNGGDEIRVVSTTPGFTIQGAAKAAGVACPANPLASLAGSQTFFLEGFGPSLQPFASAGQFDASIGTQGGNPVGRLTITNTSSQNGQITGLETDVGTYQVFPGCFGGTLTFNLSTRPLQFDFFFVSGSETRIVSSTPGFTIHGATRSLIR